MSETSYNGWPASKDPATIDVVPLTVDGVAFVGGVRKGDVETVLTYVIKQFHHRVQALQDPGCWGWFFKPDANDPSLLSCHSSGTAVDANAPKHPNGVEATKNFTAKQIAEIHTILAEVPELAETVHWGGDWHYPSLVPDPMHWEIHDHDTAQLARVATRIKENAMQKPTRVQQARQYLQHAVELLEATPKDRVVVHQEAKVIKAAAEKLPPR